jgi:spore germination protein YaaH
MRLRGHLIAASMSAALISGLAVGPAGAASARPGRVAASGTVAITGFQRDWDSTSYIDHNAASLATVDVDGINLATGGKSASAPTADDLKQLAAARRDGVRAELVFSNYDGSIGDFSEANAYALFSHSAYRSAVVGALAADVQRSSWNGINVDLEALQARDMFGLTLFMQELRAALPSAAELTIDVTCNTSEADFRSEGYNLRALGQTVTRVLLMGYDDNGPWESTPGPIGPLPWQQQGLSVLLKDVPAAQVDLGVAGYGYEWPNSAANPLSDAQARALVKADGAKAVWNSTDGEFTARLSNGSTLWWSDSNSLAARAPLVQSLHLHGLAVWSLGQSDRITL